MKLRDAIAQLIDQAGWDAVMDYVLLHAPEGRQIAAVYEYEDKALGAWVKSDDHAFVIKSASVVTGVATICVQCKGAGCQVCGNSGLEAGND